MDDGLEVETIRSSVDTSGNLVARGIIWEFGDDATYVSDTVYDDPALLQDMRAISPCDTVRALLGALFTNLEGLSRDAARSSDPEDVFDCANDDAKVFPGMREERRRLVFAGDICLGWFMPSEDGLDSSTIGILRMIFVLWSDALARSTLMEDPWREPCIVDLYDVPGAVLGFIENKGRVNRIGCNVTCRSGEPSCERRDDNSAQQIVKIDRDGRKQEIYYR